MSDETREFRIEINARTCAHFSRHKNRGRTIEGSNVDFLGALSNHYHLKGGSLFKRERAFQLFRIVTTVCKKRRNRSIHVPFERFIVINSSRCFFCASCYETNFPPLDCASRFSFLDSSCSMFVVIFFRKRVN